MTAIAAPLAAPAPTSRIVSTIRVHLANPWTLFLMPWLILMVVFAVNFTIWHLVILGAGDRPIEPGAFTNSGGVAYVLVYAVVVAVQAMNQTFSFVVGLGSTRRDYFLGSGLIFVGSAVQFGVGIALLAGIERLTNGWGVQGAFFAPGPLQHVPLLELAVIFTLALAFMYFLGTGAAAVFMRWGATGLVVFFAVLAAVNIAAVYAITYTNSWGAIARFVTGHSMLELSVMTIPVTVACALIGWALMRRATPRG